MQPYSHKGKPHSTPRNFPVEEKFLLVQDEFLFNYEASEKAAEPPFAAARLHFRWKWNFRWNFPFTEMPQQERLVRCTKIFTFCKCISVKNSYSPCQQTDTPYISQENTSFFAKVCFAYKNVQFNCGICDACFPTLTWTMVVREE